MFPRVAIIVLNYNGQNCLPDCLTSLEALSYPDKEIIVVDNGSTDDSLALAKRNFPQCIFIENKTNLGFAGGMNSGIRFAIERGADFLWLFNYDAVAKKESLSLLVEATMKHPMAGLLSPVITGQNGEIWFAKGRIDFLRMRAVHVPSSIEDIASDAYPSSFLTGCALFIKREVIEKIGFLDEGFFLYYEDADFCLRAAKAGFQSLVVPRARVIHAEKSRKNSEKTYHLVYSGLRFSAKHAPLALRPYLLGYATIRRLKNRLDLLRRRDGAASVARAFRDFSRYEHLPSFLDRYRQL
jgi:GT2 family glycosyltransferase